MCDGGRLCRRRGVGDVRHLDRADRDRHRLQRRQELSAAVRRAIPTAVDLDDRAAHGSGDPQEREGTDVGADLQLIGPRCVALGVEQLPPSTRSKTRGLCPPRPLQQPLMCDTHS